MPHEISEKHDDVATASVIDNWPHETERRMLFLSQRFTISRESISSGLFSIHLTRHKRRSNVFGKSPLREKDCSDMTDQARRGPFETSRCNLIVGGAAMVAAFGLPMRSFAYRLVCNFMFWTVKP
jgi:hypothetical protein